MRGQLMRMYGHMVWADTRVLERLRQAPQTDAVRLYAHVLGAEAVWLSRLRGEEMPLVAVWPELELELDGCAALAERNRREYAAYMGALDDAVLASAVTYRNSAGAEFTNAVHDVLTQVMLHGSHHRGQINARLRDAAAEPVLVDYIVWVREGAPLPPAPEPADG